MKELARMLVVAGVLGAAAVGCSTTYTEADLQAQAKKENADLRTEEVQDPEVAEEGGANQVDTDEDEGWVDADSEL